MNHLKPRLAFCARLWIIALSSFLLLGCSTNSSKGEGPTRAELDEMGDKAVANLLEIVFNDASLLDRVAAGAWHYEAGAEAAVGGTSAEGTTKTADKGYQAFKLVESGAIATVTVRVARAKPYLD